MLGLLALPHYQADAGKGDSVAVRVDVDICRPRCKCCKVISEFQLQSEVTILLALRRSR